jgi:hypothetical protein
MNEKALRDGFDPFFPKQLTLKTMARWSKEGVHTGSEVVATVGQPLVSGNQRGEDVISRGKA